MDKYRHYFDIDPDYFPAVNADVIKKNPDLWKKFYPHDTFVKLLKHTVDVLTRKQKLNIWVEGAYGTGKSHAVLTLKRLLDANEQDTRDYFTQFNLDTDLCNKFVGAKNKGKIITVHRYGSSSIHGDNDLILAIQESVEHALAEAGIVNAGSDALKTAIVKYLSDSENKQMFEILVKGSYSELFGGDSVDDIVNNLQTFKDQSLQTLMAKIFKVANEKQIKAFTLDDKGLVAWLREVIHENDLSALVFIWDEFTEYFNNNTHHLTGFQTLLELSETEPFCFIAVTHKSEALFADTDSDKSKILGRFVRPTCEIQLPENMAFKLMGEALQKVDDDVVRDEWNDIQLDLCDRTIESRKIVQKMAGIQENELAAILPIHPYAASLLKHIATSFESNQRSMFDFIKNDRGEEIKGFQWFIDNKGPEDDNPLLTIDMLWGFFYDMGKENLAHNVRVILDYYPRILSTKKITSEEQQVLKAVLMLQAISMELHDSVELFHANEKNLCNAFEGSDLENNRAVSCAEKLVRDGILYKKRQQGDKFVYSVLTGEMDSNKIDEQKKQFESKTTSNLIVEGNLGECIVLPKALTLRYEIDYAGATDFEQKAKKAIASASYNQHKLYCVVTFAKDNNEAAVINKKIKEILQKNPDTNVIFIDTSKTILGEDQFKEWVEQKATSSYYVGKDNSQCQQYSQYANTVLNKWKQRIADGQFFVYTTQLPNGDSKANADILIDALMEEDRKLFRFGLEHNKVHDPMWTATMLKVGAECGVLQKTKSAYTNQKKLEKAFDGAWEVEEYWKKSPTLPISRVKTSVNDLIEQTMEREGRISIQKIYDHLKDSPFGFMPCNYTAFAIGFLLKEYILDGKYTWSDGVSSDELTLEKFKEMVDEVIKLDNTPNPRYRDKYIVTMTSEEKSFIETTATAFNVSKSLCSSLEQARERIRSRMKEFGFPIWSLIYILDEEDLESEPEAIKEVINLYCGIANNTKDSGKSENDIAIEIGKICINEPKVVDDLKKLLSKDKCTEGMQAYLSNYKNGALVDIANDIQDGGKYINAVRAKFDADAANWVWKQDTVDQKIDEVICEYQIALETSKILSSCKSYEEALHAWSDKCNNMRLSYQAIKNEVGDADVLLSKLYTLRKEGRIPESQKADFLTNIKDYGNNFKDLYNNQKDMFVKVAAFYLDELSEDDKETVFKKVSAGCFTMDNSSYMHNVELIVANYKKQLGSQKLKAYWKEKTGTDTPYQWSSKYQMPILIMIPEAEWSDCKKVFGVIGSKNPDTNSIESAQLYLDKFKLWDDLNDESKRDAAFIKYIIADKSTMLKDINEVKTQLTSHITGAPYDWYSNPQVRTYLDKLAQARYNSGGFNEAFAKIDAMPADKVKQYLKDLIKNNMTVGIEIIKDK